MNLNAEEISNSLGMKLVYVPPGKFLMGSPESEPGREAWDSYGRTCNATSRSASTETHGGSQLGFRLARVPSNIIEKSEK